ncbi:MAG: hypothetical protein F4069_08915 [Rhodothermaceae bacterium]|nr:hypothetical protein [Rhodothermaceae bacterium]MYE63276.1 hypothetical protein [Rhodothermaceae bacterium]MYG70524.1 hypothetical protein [Rhodothermaceae bacterium]MYJ19916.1 hypothetical protein [Rhodothermaceae bacterium]MYJ45427.1 hypothetical protein [Rhodothermaceae bacterium]
MQFFKWINNGAGRLVIGGKLTHELSDASEIFRRWAKTARIKGRMRVVQDGKVNQKDKELAMTGDCLSDDSHIIALAQVSGARLLYSNDKTLHKDFTNKQLIDRPRGKVYSTLKDGSFSKTHQRLLADRNFCGMKS